MGKNKKTSVPEKNKFSKNVSNQSKKPEIVGEKATEKETGTEPANESSLRDATILNKKNVNTDKTSEIKHNETQNPVEESGSEKDIVTNEISQETDTRQP